METALLKAGMNRGDALTRPTVERLPLANAIWWALALVAGIDIVWMAYARFEFSWQSVPRDQMISVLVLCAALGIGRYVWRAGGLCLLAEALLLFALGHFTLYVASYLAATIGRPLVDGELIAFDHQLGQDWIGYVSWIKRHPTIESLLWIPYHFQEPLDIVMIAILALKQRTHELQGFLLALLLAGALTIIIATLWPAVGAYEFYGLSHPSSAIHLEGLRAGSLRRIPPVMQGLVAFPSFHVVTAVILFWASRGLKRWIGVSGLWNAATIAATPAWGGHYFADIYGGVVVACVAMTVADALAPQARVVAMREANHQAPQARPFTSDALSWESSRSRRWRR